MKQKNKDKFDPKSALSSSLLGLAVSAGAMNIIGGGMDKMFGYDKDKVDLNKVVKEMMHGATGGILDHFEWKLDEAKRENEILQKKVQSQKDKIEETEAAIDATNQRVEELLDRIKAMQDKMQQKKGSKPAVKKKTTRRQPSKSVKRGQYKVGQAG